MTVSCPPQPPATSSLEQVLQRAVSHHQAGRLQEAEELYLAILQTEPAHPDANHNMGVLAVHRGQAAVGLPYFEAALGASPEQPHHWLSYIETLIQTGQAEVARQVLALGPQHGLQGAAAEALAAQLAAPVRNMAQAAAAQQRGAEAAPSSGKQAEKTKAKKTAGTAASNKLGEITPNAQEIDALMALYGQGRVAEVETLARSLTTRFPQHGFGWKVLGHVLQLQGRLEEALAPMQKAAALSPGDVEAHNNLGTILLGLGRHSAAEASYRQALKIKPGYADAHSNLGIVLRNLGQLASAAASCRRALEINPDYAEAHNNLGNALRDLGQFDDAAASYRRALQIKPDFAEAHNSLGAVLRDLGQLDGAAASYRRALELKPDYVEAHSNLGSLLQDRGHFDAAAASYRRAIEIKPDFAEAHSNLLFCLGHNEEIDSEALFAEHCRFGEQFEAPLRAAWPQHGNPHDPQRRLQIGFVSGDLCNHAVANYIEPLLPHLAGYANLTLHAYANHAAEDSMSRRLQAYFTHWYPIVGLSDAALAEKIRADGIDILIDLSGHSTRHRLLTFARKPAPLQATWIGYPGTTGLSAMDYYVTDRYFLPHGKFDAQFTEKIARLPAGALFLPFKAAPPVRLLPALGNGYVTFGSFNNPGKLSPAVIALWARLLRALPDSRMLLGAMPQDGQHDVLIDLFTREGIARDRLSFHPRCGMDVYLELHNQVDICLDTFPYNGGTTTLHAISMGVPTLSLIGRPLPGRSSSAILGHAGLDAFLACEAADFVQKGVSWAADLSSLASLRAGLRARFAQSAMNQSAMVAAGLERALRFMWQRWCAGLPAESFDVQLQDLVDVMKRDGS